MKEVAIAIWAGFFSFYTICIYGSEVLNFEWVMIVLRLNLKVFTIWCTIWHCIYLSLFQDMFFIQKSGSKFAVKQTLITLIKTYIYLQNTKLNGNSERNIYNIYSSSSFRLCQFSHHQDYMHDIDTRSRLHNNTYLYRILYRRDYILLYFKASKYLIIFNNISSFIDIISSISYIL
jgi:hypothetical protein